MACPPHYVPCLPDLCVQSLHPSLDRGLFPPAVFDFVLGCSGITLTLTAAYGFSSHRFVKNPASGALEEAATITFAEMIEHSFYQGVNLVQAMYLHAMSGTLGVPGLLLLPQPLRLPQRLVAMGLATLPWALRSRFPVNSFSANYSGKPFTLINFLYRLKKYQV